MKLPGIQYRGVQGLARQDVNAPVRLAGAEAGATDAWSQVMRPAVQGADEIMTDIAKDRSNKAMNVYHSEKLKWQSEQIALDENGEPAWENGGDRFNAADEAARAKANEVIGNSVFGQTLFTEAADRANVQYGASWQNKVKRWYKDDQMGTANASIELATQQRDFDKVTDIIADNAQRGIFTRVQTEKLFAVNSANRVNNKYLTSIGMATGGEGYSQLRNDIKNEPGFSDIAREKMELRLDARITENNTSALRGIMQTMEGNLGINVSVDEGRKIVHYAAGLTGEENTGFTTDAAQQRDRNAQLAVWREWEAKREKQTAANKMIGEMDCVFKATCLVTTGKSDERKRHDNAAEFAIGRIPLGKNKFDNNGIENTTILAATPEGEKARTILSTMARGGYVHKVTREAIDAGVTSSNPADVGGAWDLVNAINEASPNALGENLNPMTRKTLPVLQAFDKEMAVGILMKAKGLSSAEVSQLRSAFDEEKYDDTQFEAVLKDVMPVEHDWWFNTSADRQLSFKNRVNDLAKELYPITGGNIAASYTAAMNAVSKDFGTDQTLGRVVKDPVAKNVIHGEVDGGKWVHDMVANELPGFNKDEMPDSYDLFKIPGKGPNDYVINFLDADGLIKSVTAEFKFEETARGRQYFKEESEAATERDRLTTIANDNVFASSTDDAWESAPDTVKWAVTLDKIKEYQGKNAGSIGAAIDKGVDILINMGTEAGKALFEINQRKVAQMTAQSKKISDKYNAQRPASAKQWAKITGRTK